MNKLYQNLTCMFAPDIGNTGKYQHSKRNEYGWNLSDNIFSRNMDLFYRTFLNFSKIGCTVKNSFMSIDVEEGEYMVSVYELGNVETRKITVK